MQPSASRTTNPSALYPSSKLLGYYHSSALRTDKLSLQPGRYHHPTRAAAFPGLLPVLLDLACEPVATAPGSDRSAVHQLVCHSVCVEYLPQDFQHPAHVDGD